MGRIGLHLAVEIGNFIVPYMTLIGPTDFFENNSFYMTKLGEGHEPVLNHFMQQAGEIKGFGITGFLERTSLVWMYIGNVAIMISSLIFPLILWYLLYKKKQVSVPPWILATIFASAACYAASPLFIIRYIPSGSALVGVDILTKPINNNTHLFLLSVIVFIAVYIISEHKKIREYLIGGGFGIGLIFLGYYLAQFYYSWWLYTQSNMTKLLLMGGTKNIFMMLILISFFIILTIVYLLGYWEFIKHSKETLKQINQR